ncbi:MAG: hypothetical protein AB9856_07570 [Cellulosilyticaceae bacterium]
MSCLFIEEGAWGTKLPLTDDSYQYVDFSPEFKFCFYDKSYHGVYINSNGNITFNEGDETYFQTFEGFIDSPNPRIAAFWTDLYPEFTTERGGVYFNALENVAVITWVDIPFFWSEAKINTFQILLCQNGIIGIAYDTLGDDFFEEEYHPLIGIAAGNGGPSKIFAYDGVRNQNSWQTVQGPMGKLNNSQIFFRLTYCDYELIDRLINFESKILIPCGFNLGNEQGMNIKGLLSPGCSQPLQLKNITLTQYNLCENPTRCTNCLPCKEAYGAIKLDFAVLMEKVETHQLMVITKQKLISIEKILTVGDIDGIEQMTPLELENGITLEALEVGDLIETTMYNEAIYSVNGTIRLNVCCKWEGYN